jgi:hypothetical protein
MPRRQGNFINPFPFSTKKLLDNFLNARINTNSAPGGKCTPRGQISPLASSWKTTLVDIPLEVVGATHGKDEVDEAAEVAEEGDGLVVPQ